MLLSWQVRTVLVHAAVVGASCVLLSQYPFLTLCVWPLCAEGCAEQTCVFTDTSWFEHDGRGGAVIQKCKCTLSYELPCNMPSVRLCCSHGGCAELCFCCAKGQIYGVCCLG
jgi:hypothetical protein